MKKVVFVHGLGGDLNKTWGKFPELIDSDSDLGCRSVTYGYDAFYWPFIGSSASLHNIAEGLESEIRLNCEEDEELILVGHSLGGLVIKKFLANQIINKNKHNFNIKKVCFYAVPHEGSGLSEIRKLIGWRNQQLKVLAKDSKYIEEFNDIWDALGAKDKFEFLSVIGSKDSIVTSSSSKSLFRGSDIITLNEKGHINIVKPKDSNDSSYKALKKFILSKESIIKYTNNAAIPYEKWRRHDRKHHAPLVQDESRLSAANTIKKVLDSDSPLIRITGLSGLGKSRLVIEYINSLGMDENDIIIFDATSKVDEIKQCIDRVIKEKAEGIIVIENCHVELHNYISREIINAGCIAKIITVAFGHEDVESSVHVKLQTLESNSINKLVQNILPDFNLNQIEKIASFVEGYPLLAVLIAERYREDGILNGELTEDAFVERLLHCSGQLSDEKLRVLTTFSLFDVIAVEGENNDDAKFIYDFSEAKRSDFDEVFYHFEEREIINKVGNFARIVPKPLAVTLAAKWWESSLDGSKVKLINEMPDSLLGSFCNQIKYLDNSQKVIDFVEGLCSKFSPFGKAELLLSKRGSKLFRALVEVNPKATSELIYRTICQLTDEELNSINGDIRRNFVWALEMLAFHKKCFEQSSWCLLKLAQFENESFSNNATGQFSQLFRWRLSGSAADFDTRVKILSRAISLDCLNINLIVIEAIKAAIDTRGGTRAVGAEYQGTKPELKEWQPELWNEIFDYWQNLFDILVGMASNRELIEPVKNVIGHQIRGLVRNGRLQMLDDAIKKIIQLSDKYWPAASQSITHALTYDAKSLKEEQLVALNEWTELLAPDADNLEEKLKLVVLNPSRDHEKDEEGHYVDLAAVDAKKLAKELTGCHSELSKYFELLTTFPEQKQSWIFGKELALNEVDSKPLLNGLFEFLRNCNSHCNTQFLSGLLNGLSTSSPKTWEDYIVMIGSDERLVKYYPDAIRTGLFKVVHLEKLLELIRLNKLHSRVATVLVYGRVTEHLTEEEVVNFCLSLSNIDATATWVALDIVNMYTHGRDDYDFNLLKELLTHLVLSVSFAANMKSGHTDSYHWLKTVETLLKTEGAGFALKLCNHLIEEVIQNDVDYSDLWDYLHVAFYKAFKLHGDEIWSELSDKLINNEGIKKYRLIELLGSGKESRDNSNSIFTLIDQSVVVELCKEERALILVAGSLSLFDKNEGERKVNNLVILLLEAYGNNKDFLSILSSNFHSRSWSGSLVPYLEADKKTIEVLQQHTNLLVKSWADDFISMIDRQIDAEIKSDAEEQMLRS